MGCQELVLWNFLLQIEQGLVIVVIGLSGSGKMFLVWVVFGLYCFQMGVVFVDDFDICQLDVGEWCNVIGYVLECYDFFYGIIVQNFFMVNLQVDNDQV